MRIYKMEKINKNCDNFKNALFINYGGLGDEILFLPAIEDFKRNFPDCKITLCLEGRAKGVKQITPLIDDIIEVDIKAEGFRKYINVLNMIKNARFTKEKFDVVISSGKSPFVSVILYLTGIKRRCGYFSKTSFLLTDGVELDSDQYAGNMYHDLILPFLDENSIDDKVMVPHIEADENYVLPPEISGVGPDGAAGDFVALHPGVSKMSIDKGIFKCPGADFWIKVAEGVLRKGKKLVLLGGPDDKEIIEKIVSDERVAKNPLFVNFYGKTKNLCDLVNVISKAKTFICADSAPLHIGVGLGVDIVTIFGPTNENKLVPKKDNIKVITKNVNCRPCLWHKRQFNCKKSLCLDINADDVIAAV